MLCRVVELCFICACFNIIAIAIYSSQATPGKIADATKRKVDETVEEIKVRYSFMIKDFHYTHIILE